jgi:glutamate--cysteine ligase
VLVAISACSPMLAGEASGWRSMRQQMWTGIDGARSARLPAGDPAEQWAMYALAAPVMLVRDHETGGAEAVPARVSFASWITGAAKLVRRPTLQDLDYHLTTLYPPVRLRGYVELRYLDAVPHRWWPALAAITAALAEGGDAVAAACEPVASAWVEAARDGLSDPLLSRAARTCLAIAHDRAPAALRAEVAAYAGLVDAGRTPGDLLGEHISECGPVAVLTEEAR